MQFRLLKILTDSFNCVSSSLISQASDGYLPYPGWALAVLALLIIFAMMPVPVGLIHSVLLDRRRPVSRDTEAGQYSIVNTDETPMTDMSELDHRNGLAASVS